MFSEMVTCPHCAELFEFTDSYENLPLFDHECPECGKDMVIFIEVEVSHIEADFPDGIYSVDDFDVF